MTTARHVVLVGLMATGKSTIGRLVADTLDRPLVDSDAQVEARTGRSVREIWRTDGEPAFRRLEHEALTAALDQETPAVIAAAGGVVLAEENRRRLRGADADVVWLRARVPTLLARIRAAGEGHRPLLDSDPEATLGRMHADRSARYEEVADHVVDVDDAAPDDVARAVVAAVTGTGGASRAAAGPADAGGTP